MGNRRICELCSGEAVVYCLSDSAFLCLSCDAKVHGANFLVARHVRKIVCCNCEDFTGDQISGMVFQAKASICQSCSPELGSGELDSLSSSSSSACVSSAQSSSFCAATRKTKLGRRGGGGGITSLPVAQVNGGQGVKWGIDSKTVGILVNWCKRSGVNDDVATVVVRMACNGLAVCAGKLTVLPFRVCLVASLWFGLRFSGVKSLSAQQSLSRLEQMTGVPAKLIAAAESKIERLYKSAKQTQIHTQLDQQLMKEGWAESS